MSKVNHLIFGGGELEYFGKKFSYWCKINEMPSIRFFKAFFFNLLKLFVEDLQIIRKLTCIMNLHLLHACSELKINYKIRKILRNMYIYY